MAHKVGLYCFTNDLRLHDQPALSKAASDVDQLICYYLHTTAWSQHARDMSDALGAARQNFLNQSVDDLSQQLRVLGQSLWISQTDDSETTLAQLIDAVGATDVYRSEQAAWFENTHWAKLQADFPHIRFQSVDTRTLYDKSTLPFSIESMPGGFSGVRNKLEKTEPCPPIATIKRLPPMPALAGFCDTDARLPPADPSLQIVQWPEKHTRTSHTQNITLTQPASAEAQHFTGGERVGLTHLSVYLASGAASSYKKTRNALDGWQYSCKFSPWLATGSLSVRQVVAALKQYEVEHGSNESTDWIWVELLWREYFQWYALRHGPALYQYGGPQHKALPYTDNPERIDSWKAGITGYSLVDACMTELRLTGFLSNRGRQIVASCLVNELEQDWRFGAAYFEQMLIDYDTANNWGNWQYIAGAGPATVNKRHFNLDKQVSQFDPRQRYTKYWLKQRDAAN